MQQEKWRQNFSGLTRAQRLDAADELEHIALTIRREETGPARVAIRIGQVSIEVPVFGCDDRNRAIQEALNFLGAVTSRAASLRRL